MNLFILSLSHLHFCIGQSWNDMNEVSVDCNNYSHFSLHCTHCLFCSFKALLWLHFSQNILESPIQWVAQQLNKVALARMCLHTKYKLYIISLCNFPRPHTLTFPWHNFSTWGLIHRAGPGTGNSNIHNLSSLVTTRGKIDCFPSKEL